MSGEDRVDEERAAGASATTEADAAAGPVAPDEPASRRELELALRAAHLTITELRDDLHALAAQVVALSEATAQLAAAQAPASSTAGAEAGRTAAAGFDAAVEARTAALRRQLALADARATSRLLLAPPEDKYAIASDDGPPCQELLPVCGARCCRFEVALSSADLDEGGLRWDYAMPYALAKRADGQCVHHDDAGCGVYATRPATCRRYDCREDRRVWLDYERGILAPMPQAAAAPPSAAELEQRVRDLSLAKLVEVTRLRRR